MRFFIALIRREILENNNLWRVPLFLIGLALLVRLSLVFGNLAFDFNVPAELRLDSTIDGVVDNALAAGLNFMNSVVVLVMFVVAIFYALACLFNERQDQSILFWRSLPISDGITIASKLAVALVLVPLIIVVCQVVMAIMFLGFDGIRYLGDYLGASLPKISKVLLWTMVPTVAWCVFCSEFAKKSPYLLALFAPVVFVVVDRLFLDGVLSEQIVVNRVIGFKDYTLTPLIVGLVLAGIFVALTIVRRSQRI